LLHKLQFLTHKKKIFHKVCSPYPHCIIKFSFRQILRQKIFPDFSEFRQIFGNVDMVNKLYAVFFFHSCRKKLELTKQIHLFKRGFMIFLKGAAFSDFFETRQLNYITSGIQNRYPLFWRIYFQLGSHLIK